MLPIISVPNAIIAATLLPLAACVPQATFSNGIVQTAPAVVTPESKSQGSFTGTPTVTGALTASTILATALTPETPPAAATTYPSDGDLHDAMPAPFVPGGGLGTNGTMPAYRVQSDYDYQSVALALYMEWLQFDLFNAGLQQFSDQDFQSAGLTSEQRSLFRWMMEQSIGHITLLTNILGDGDGAPAQCRYNFPFNNVGQFVDFCQKTARTVESTIYGFLPHMDSRPVASLLLSSVSITARQQLIFRQLQGLFPMPVWFEAPIPQSWGWSLLAPYITECPGSSRLVWQNFPELTVVNQPNPFAANGTNGGGAGGGGGNRTSSGVIPGIGIMNTTGPSALLNPAIVGNRTLSQPGRQVSLSWASSGSLVGPNNSYVTTGSSSPPSFVAWVTQLNVTYSPLMTTGGGGGGDNQTGGGAMMTGTTMQPDLSTFMGDPAVNGTVFIAVTDSNVFVTPFNVSMINPHVVAGPAIYQAG